MTFELSDITSYLLNSVSSFTPPGLLISELRTQNLYIFMCILSVCVRTMYVQELLNVSQKRGQLQAVMSHHLSARSQT